MALKMQSIIVVEYNGPQGSRELSTVEDVSINRSKPRNKVKTMNRSRRAIGYQSGTEDVNATLTIVPELLDPEIDWHRAWKDDEVFTLLVEKGLDGIREQLIDCTVSDINDTANENGDARLEVSLEALRAVNEPT